MLKRILNFIKIITNPLLYYVDKSGNSVFRNYCWFKNTACKYNTTIPNKNAGKTLEFRMEIDKYLKRVYILTPLVLYLIFIHIKLSFGSILLFELLWLGIVCGCRIAASCIFSRHLVKTFGKYKLISFRPYLPKAKYREFISLYLSKVLAIVIVLGLLFIPSLFMQLGIKLCITKTKNFKQAINISKTYFSLYPKNTKIYDMRAYAKFRLKDYEGALEDYITVLNLTGKKFYEEDIIRLANLLYLKRALSSSNEAVDLFNEYATKKDASILQASKLLWIKSIFKVENNIPETIVQDYDDLLASINPKDYDNQFNVASDKAYILYLMKEYETAVEVYNPLISYANANKEKYSKELQALYAERGFAKLKLGDTKSADDDFIASGITPWDMSKYEPRYSNQAFISDFK